MSSRNYSEIEKQKLKDAFRQPAFWIPMLAAVLDQNQYNCLAISFF